MRERWQLLGLQACSVLEFVACSECFGARVLCRLCILLGDLQAAEMWPTWDVVPQACGVDDGLAVVCCVE
jgi:hypothetical protein